MRHSVIAAATGKLFVSDTPVGNRPFWKTRPIERWAMLTSKLLYAAVFFSLIPLVLNFVWAWRFGMGPLEWVSVGAWQALLGTFLFLPLAALASLVRTFALYFLAVFVVGVTTLAILIAEATYLPHPDMDAWLLGSGPEAALAQSVTLIVVIVAALVVLALQYLRQHRTLAMATAACGYLLGLTPAYWAGPLATALLPVETAQTDLGLSAELSPAVHAEEGFWGFQEPPRVRIPAIFSIDGLAPDQILYELDMEGHLAFPGSDVIDLSWDLPDVIAYSKPGLAGLASFPLRSPATRIDLRLYNEPYPAPADRTGVFRGALQARVGRLRKLGSMPLKPGASLDAGSRRFVLETSSQTQTLVTLSLLSRAMGSPLDRESPLMLLVVNPERAEHLTAPIALSGAAGMVSISQYFFSEPLLITNRNEKKVGLRYPSDEGVVSATPSWLQDAQLQVFSVEPVGRATIPLEVDDFRLRMLKQR